MDTDTVKKTYEELEKENEQLRQISAMKSDWISISAHQLRTSLSAIKWILKMFQDGDFGALTPEQEGFMKKAYESNERMLTLVNEMLTLNHVEYSSLKYNFERKNVVAFLDEALFDFTSESYKKGVELIFLKPDIQIPDLYFDVEKIRVVLQNLIENAIKYSNEGNRIVLSLRPTEDNKFIEFRIKDTGIGIPENEQHKIFEKFYRASNAQKKFSVGSGLGLFTTKSIIERHGGTIWFDSKESSGTTFYFTLPIER
jgi:signal transduction histidine kinase